ncbi:hypothetical protein Goshw_019659 [Gossypium schwendimanii]|uniref:RNase H type-1 domain-containing protein n=1 Tax=Gossypium schwendimanii TaxID=34291 RepID=A0A7J9NCI4_GOSSC|nr:hypothetical protein [Gossypium schwendimanii]
MNEDLTRAFSYEEECLAIKTMSLLMALGEDGLGVVLYQRFCHIVGKEVADYCIELLNDFRVFFITASMKCICPWKAYLRQYPGSLRSPSFHEKEEIEKIRGDPLSAYLFLICNEGLPTLLGMAFTSGDLKGIRINRHAPLINHLFFADDNIIFGDVMMERARALKDKLEIYASSSRQFSAAKQIAALGFIFRNEEGEIIRSGFRTNTLVKSVVMAEAIAMLHGIQFASEMGFMQVILESDSKIDVKALARSFLVCRFEFIAREGNTVAHGMAEEGMWRLENCY